MSAQEMLHPFACIGMAKLCEDHRLSVGPTGVLCHNLDTFIWAAELADAKPEACDDLTSGGRQAFKFMCGDVEFTAFLSDEEQERLA